MGLFVNIEIHQNLFTSKSEREKVAIACPVDIFFVDDDSLQIHHELVDECTFCYLCLQNSPSGAIQVLKTYQERLDNP